MEDKEKLEEMRKKLDDIDHVFFITEQTVQVSREVYFWLEEQAERNVTAQETVEMLGESLKQSIEQNKRFRELLEFVIDGGDCSSIDYIARELYSE